MLGKLRAGIRFLGFMLLMIFFILRLLVTGIFTGFKVEIGVRHRQQFCRAVIPILGIQVHKKGKANHQNVLFISNHRSYIDPFVETLHITALAVAKAEVRSWPIIGFGIKITGTYFVQRDDKSSRKAAREGIARTIKNGYSMLVYPEGTTTDLPQTIAFKPRTFDMAAENNVKIVPIAIEYQDSTDAWIGDDTFIRHFFQVFAKKKVICKVHYGGPMWAEEGAILKEKVQRWIDGELMVIRENWGLPT